MEERRGVKVGEGKGAVGLMCNPYPGQLLNLSGLRIEGLGVALNRRKRAVFEVCV